MLNMKYTVYTNKKRFYCYAYYLETAIWIATMLNFEEPWASSIRIVDKNGKDVEYEYYKPYLKYYMKKHKDKFKSTDLLKSPSLKEMYIRMMAV